MNPATVRLFQRAVHLWLVGYVLTALPEAGPLWIDPVSPAGHGAWIPHLVAALPVPDRWVGLPAALLLLALSAFGLWREPPRWMALLIAVLFTVLVHRSWLMATGGHWLMTNVLLWMVALRAHPSGRGELWWSWLGFHAIRLQLCLAYAMSALNKLAGGSWLDGTALLRIAGDGTYGPTMLAQHPLVAALLGFGVLVLLLALPIALWVPALRRPALIAALMFHLVSGVWFHIPDMALAFAAVLMVWTSSAEAESVARLVKALMIKRKRAGDGRAA